MGMIVRDKGIQQLSQAYGQLKAAEFLTKRVRILFGTSSGAL
jgi:hypothetical protein